ncbi:splicing factor [Tanacetum coccineum]
MADDDNESSDAYCSSDEEDLSYVDFHTELDDNVVINTVTTNDPFLNKLCGDSADFINLVDEHVNANIETVVEDTENIDPVFNVKEGISYLTYDPNQDWKKMEPVLGMRFHHPEQIKLCLANYGVANGYPLWFYRNDWKKLLVYCGRDVKSGGLREHYGRLWEYRQAILDSNQGSTCRLDGEETESGNYYFRRIYVCFKGVKYGWLAGCRKVIGLDGCFLKHTCRRELLVAMGRDANNQMYLIAWAVFKVENNENWCCLIQEDLQLQTRERLTIISDSHKGLLEGVNELLPNAEHRKCTRHLFANYKKKFSGVQFQCLFWNATSTTDEQLYYSKMEELKIISPKAYQYLCDGNPNSWCRAFFRQESKCLNFENGICKSFNRAILVQRTKPIITMLEDIRLYVMQRLVAMNRVARTWEHSITPSIRKRVEVLKEK